MGQFPTEPVQRIKPWAAAVVLADHLSNDHLRVGINVELTGVEFVRSLQGLKQGEIFGNVIVLPPNPFTDRNASFFQAFDYDSHASRSRISQRSTIHVSHQIKH